MHATPRKRFLLLVAAVVAVAVAVGARLFHLQIVSSEQLRARASRQHVREIEVTTPRGTIVDRSGRELAVSLETQSLFAHPRRVDRPERAAQLLAPIVGLTRREILARLTADKNFVYLGRFLEPEQVRAIRTLDLPLGDNEPFGLLPSSKRYYPRGELAVHVVGFANIDGEGVEGIERQFDDELRGDPVTHLVLQDGRNGQFRRVDFGLQRHPDDVVLTLDLFLQYVTERELDRAMTETGAQSASAVVLDPTTGQVLALANRPAADPNRYGESRGPERVNRAAVHQYEPGSTFKIVTLAAALERGRVRPTERVNCENGTYVRGGRLIRDAKPHGILTTSEIFQKSSNIGMVKLIERLDREELSETILRFGFGSRTGIELPGELEGFLRPTRAWSGHTQASLAFGQEIGVTVLQMAAAMAAIANDGVLVPPRLVLGLRDHEGHLRPSERPAARRVVSSRTARELTLMLEQVLAEGGTGTRAQVEGYRLAGKSGTAQKVVNGVYSDSDYVASFGGFGPLRSPRAVVLVVLDSPRGAIHQGGQVAAPVFAGIMREALAYLRVPAEHEAPLVARAPRPGATAQAALASFSAGRIPTGPGMVPDLAGMSLREAITSLAAEGYGTWVRGNGVVIVQEPSPGTPLGRGEICRLGLGELPDPAAGATHASARPGATR